MVEPVNMAWNTRHGLQARKRLLWQLTVTAIRAVSGARAHHDPRKPLFVRVTLKLNRHSEWSGNEGSQGKHQRSL
jgi:hypothetical protein